MQDKSQTPTNLAYKLTSGFTLLELLLVIVVLGIIIGLGVPSFSEYVKLARVTANQRDLVSSLKLAHSEAIKRNSTVSICVAAAVADTCDTNVNATWDQGWHVFTDSNFDLVIDNSADILQSSPAQSNSTISFQDDQNGFTFQATGEINNIVSAPQKITTCSYNVNDLSCDSASEATTIAILSSGQIVAL